MDIDLRFIFNEGSPSRIKVLEEEGISEAVESNPLLWQMRKLESREADFAKVT